jgi:cellobiose phosphorylase
MSSEQNDITRRGFIVGAGALAVAAAAPAWALPHNGEGLGEWFDDDLGLPAFRYTGALTFPNSPIGYAFEEKPQPYLGDDPYFLLGNYRLTLFAHASGVYQLFTGERAWGRMNQGEKRWSGANRATVSVDGQRHELVGMDSAAAKAAEKRFGIGFALYGYKLGTTTITRRLSVAPSRDMRHGSSAVLVQTRLRNDGRTHLKISYEEATIACYRQAMSWWDTGAREVTWSNDAPHLMGDDFAAASFTAHGKRPLTFPPDGEMSRLEAHPPTLFVKTLGAMKAFVESDAKTSVGARVTCELAPGEQKDFAFIFGYTRDLSAPQLASMLTELRAGAEQPITVASAFASEWRKKLPELANESDKVLRREMRWNAAVLEQMVTWREYYDETVIPQGTMYDYIWGWMASSRDLAQQALPLCHTNPELARSTLRFIMKRTLPDGEIKLNDEGYGWASHTAMLTSDQQLHFFLLLNEYLRKTKDFSVLDERIGYYPAERAGSDTGWAHLRQCFLFLRDRISTGPHGLVKLWNSDWNDMFYFLPTKLPYNDMFSTAESLMNTAMAIVLLKELPELLHNAENNLAAPIVAAMQEYRAELLQSWLWDLGERKFPRRAWLGNNESCGEREMWVEPQGYALQIPETPAAQKQALLAEIEKRLIDGEALGARQKEKPTVYEGMEVAQPGTRENGGFWFSLNGPLILGVNSFDHEKAWAMLRRMSFANYAERFPEYWPGRWSNADSVDSTAGAHNGMTPIPVYCAHPHAWPLYCYLRLKEDEATA